MCEEKKSTPVPLVPSEVLRRGEMSMGRVMASEPRLVIGMGLRPHVVLNSFIL